jgi:ParB family chromosome partitioning protein
VSASLNGVHTDEGPHPIDALAEVANLDMREWWTPTAEGYLGGLPKARILQIVTDAVSASAAAPLGKLKKGPLAAAAEHLLVGTSWLPPILRGNTN